LTSRLCDASDQKGWRQSRNNIRQLKKSVFKLQKLKHSTSKDPFKALQKEDQIEKAYAEYTKKAESFIAKAKASEEELLKLGVDPVLFNDIHYFAAHAEKQIDLINRRVILGEVIPHEEKVFSVFEPHTEWVCKGKAGVPVELGLRVAVLEDQNGFILSHQIMQNQTDEQVAVPVVKNAKNKFPDLNSCSFDKGFHSPSNQVELLEILEAVALPKKGKLSQKEKEYQHSEKFKTVRKKHSAIESAINALEVHGLDRCPDKGLNGFERYVALAVVARNIQIVGSILIKREQHQLKKKIRRLKRAA
jgi:hypothetical protein